jgi:hypothetical protein
MSEKRKPKNKPLTCTVTREGVLRIEIGIDTLAHAALRSPWAYALSGQDAPEERLSISKPRGFAVDVRRELFDEAEDGSSLLTGLIDQATERAVNQGSEFFVDSKEPA